MTEQEYEQAKKEIIDRLGHPAYEMNRPENESAKALFLLKMSYSREKAAAKRLEAKNKGQVTAPQSFEQLAEESNDKRLKAHYRSVPLSAVLLDEDDLKPFNEKECQILIDRYNDLDEEDNVIAKRNGISTQKLASFLHSTQAKLLEMKVWHKIKRFKTIKAYLKLLESNDSKAVMRAAEDEKLISNEKVDLNVSSKPIDDPAALAMLKELGDKLANRSNNSSKE